MPIESIEDKPTFMPFWLLLLCLANSRGNNMKITCVSGIWRVDDQRGSERAVDAVILAVAHKEFLDLDVKAFVKPNGVIYDVTGLLPRDILDGRL